MFSLFLFGKYIQTFVSTARWHPIWYTIILGWNGDRDWTGYTNPKYQTFFRFGGWIDRNLKLCAFQAPSSEKTNLSSSCSGWKVLYSAVAQSNVCPIGNHFSFRNQIGMGCKPRSYVLVAKEYSGPLLMPWFSNIKMPWVVADTASSFDSFERPAHGASSQLKRPPIWYVPLYSNQSFFFVEMVHFKLLHSSRSSFTLRLLQNRFDLSKIPLHIPFGHAVPCHDGSWCPPCERYRLDSEPVEI